MSTSSLSQNELDNDEIQQNQLQSVQFQISSNSLTSSSSSSCSLFEVVPSSVNTNLNDLTKELVKQEIELNKSDLKLNFKEGNTPRTTTFAKLAAAATPTSQSTLGTSNSSNKINVTMLSTASNNNSPNTNTNPNLISKLSHLTNDKIDSILKEFKNNIFILDQMYNQASSKNLDANKLFQEKTSSMLQNSSPHQTIHLMQSINFAVTPIVKQFGSMMANSSKLNVNVNNSLNNNSDAKILDADLEIA
jgi:hypothetical protein